MYIKCESMGVIGSGPLDILCDMLVRCLDIAYHITIVINIAI